jgi:hypothetical protein
MFPLLQLGHLACTMAGHIGKGFSWLFIVQINVEHKKSYIYFNKINIAIYMLLKPQIDPFAGKAKFE